MILMKKSRGTAFRNRDREPVTPAREVTVQSGGKSGRFKAYLAAAGALIILILLILPCQYRRCGGPAGGVTRAYRWVATGVPSGTMKRRQDHRRNNGYYPAGGMRHENRRAAPHRDAVPAYKKGIHGPGNAEEKNAVKPADRSGQPDKIEPAERGARKPDDDREHREGRGAGDRAGEKKPEKPEVYDFGTKLELVPAPSNR